MALDKLLDGYLVAIDHPGFHQHLFEFTCVANLPGACCAGSVRWLDYQGISNLAGKFPCALRVICTG